MTERIDIAELAPKAYQAMFGLEKYLHGSGLEQRHIELIKLRASQINGCAFCVDMHSGDMKKQGEPDRRIWAVAAWRETSFFTPEERAVLALTEEGTRLADAHEGVSDEVWAEAEKYFSPEQMAALCMAVATINAWNRLGVMPRKAPPPLA
ncbi:carboxymuconolactone decarboxylase family protein [Actinocorallia longicatena]|uniref:Carboxymuconolactone decarboxylase family protein n=1 Tax=Actinocorallia longicatena TaxID=111803 RepID=A0ABP6QD05_9ACTN